MNPARRRPGKERATRSLRPSASLSLFPDVLFTRKWFISWKTRPAGGLNSQSRKGCGSGPRRTSPGGSAERPGPPESSLSSLLHPPPSATGFSSRLNIFFFFTTCLSAVDKALPAAFIPVGCLGTGDGVAATTLRDLLLPLPATFQMGSFGALPRAAPCLLGLKRT